MSIEELEKAVSTLPPEELSQFSSWFEEFIADEWDKRFEADVTSGKFDDLARKADEAFEAGRCTEL